ncbi:hypothetical protein Syun_027108 [Stephania yunnanensis]|uniref:Uncharacterized protein n=1 Tax=Stephania yunnanensis TaxID=152371 RepID=A0AAP0EIB6_9MAGN
MDMFQLERDFNVPVRAYGQPEVPNELPILKEGVHTALPKYVDAPFVVDISKGEDIA